MSIAVDRGIGHILHFVADILVRAVEKVLAVRQDWSEKNPEVLKALVRAHIRAAGFIEQPENRAGDRSPADTGLLGHDSGAHARKIVTHR